MTHIPLWLFHPSEYRRHPGDLPPAQRMGKTAPKKASPNHAPRGKRKRQWR